MIVLLIFSESYILGKLIGKIGIPKPYLSLHDHRTILIIYIHIYQGYKEHIFIINITFDQHIFKAYIMIFKDEYIYNI